MPSAAPVRPRRPAAAPGAAGCAALLPGVYTLAKLMIFPAARRPAVFLARRSREAHITIASVYIPCRWAAAAVGARLAGQAGAAAPSDPASPGTSLARIASVYNGIISLQADDMGTGTL